MKHLILSLLLLAAFNGRSQGLISAIERHTNLYAIKAELDPYFEDQLRNIGEKEFYHEGSEYNSYIQFMNYWEPLLFPHGDFQTYYQLEKDYWDSDYPTKAPGNLDDWSNLGPNNEADPAFSTTGNISGIGPTEFISFSENDPTHLKMLTGSIKGGLFYSDDGAETWTNLGSDAWENSGCVHAIFHPTLNNVYYACSHKHSTTGSAGPIGTMGHVKRSVGGVWETIGDFNDFGGSGNIYYKLLADPLNTNRLYLATLYGLYYTDDANDPVASIVWTKMIDPLLLGKIYDIELVPNQTGSWSDDVVVSVCKEIDDTTDQWNVVYTGNHGLTWQVLPSHPSWIVEYDAGIYLTLETSKANANSLFIKYGNSTRTIFKYNWTSHVWTSILNESDGANFGHGHTFGVCQVNESRIGTNKYLGIKTTVNGGATWSSETNTGHDDVEDIVWHPELEEVVYVANHGGVYKSTDYGSTFVSKINGLGIAESNGMAASYTNPGRIAFGAEHDFSFVTFGTYDPLGWIPDWGKKYGGDGQEAMIDYTDENNVWLSSQSYGSTSGFVFYDDINNNTSQSIHTSAFCSSGYKRAAVLNSQSPDIIYFSATRINCGTDDFDNLDVVRATSYGTAGKSWISDFGNAPHNLTSFFTYKLFTAPSDPDYLYANVVDVGAAPDVHRLYRTTNANDPVPTWTELILPQNKWIADVDVDFENPNLIYLSYSSDAGGHMLYKIDFSTSTTSVPGVNSFDLTGNLPNGAHAGKFGTALEKGTNEGVYFATNAGIYFSNANMTIGSLKYWVKIGTNSPHILPAGVEINYQINKIRVAYEGRGVWEHDLFCPQVENSTLSGVHPNGFFPEVLSTITSTGIVNNGIETDYRAGYMITLNPGFRANAGSDFNAFIHSCDSPGNSFKFSLNGLMVKGENEYEVEKDISHSEKIRVSPNPTNDLTTIAIDNFDATNTNYKLVLYNSVGQLMQQQDVTSNKTDIDLSSYKNGLYILSFSDGVNTSVVRISKIN